jgi:DNA-binding transcriptional MerR regulator
MLSPSRRTESRYQLPSDSDLVRLQQIRALKFPGFSLEETKAVLDASPSGIRETLSPLKANGSKTRAARSSSRHANVLDRSPTVGGPVLFEQLSAGVANGKRVRWQD